LNFGLQDPLTQSDDTKTTQMFNVMQVVHNYGHGGSGVTMCWGCAHDVVDILKDILCRQPSTAKTISKL